MEQILLEKVKEVGLVKDIMVYKRQMEKADLKKEINNNLKQINDIREKIIYFNKYKKTIIERATNAEIENTKTFFHAYTGEQPNLSFKEYKMSIYNIYLNEFNEKYCMKNLTKMRLKNLELQMKYEMEYGEEDRQEMEELTDKLTSIIETEDDDDNNDNDFLVGQNIQPDMLGPVQPDSILWEI